MHVLDDFLIYYLQRFDKYCFDVVICGKEYRIGKGEPVCRVIFHKDIPKKELLTSTSLALGEAYMRGDIEVEGDMFTVLKGLLEQIDQFSLDRNAVASGVRIFFWTILVVLTLSLSSLCILLDSCRPR